MFHLLGFLLILWLLGMVIAGLWHVFVFVLNLLGLGLFFLLFLADPEMRVTTLFWMMGWVFFFVVVGKCKSALQRHKRGRND